MFNLFTKPFDYYVTSLTSEQLLSTYRWYQSNHITHNDIENNDYNKNFVTLWSYTFYVTSKSRLVGTISTSRLNNIKTDLPPFKAAGRNTCYTFDNKYIRTKVSLGPCWMAGQPRIFKGKIRGRK